MSFNQGAEAGEDQPLTYSVDTQTRSWVKAITWRIIGIFILGFIAWFFTRSWEETLLISITFHSIRLVLYYAHERIWEKTTWGKRKAVPEDYSI